MTGTATTPVLEHYRSEFERLAAGGGPLAAARAAAFGRFAEQGFPAPREESWKYTSLRRLEARRYGAATHVDGAVRPRLEPLSPLQLVFVNGWLRAELGTPAAQMPHGLTLRSLATGPREDADGTMMLEIGTDHGAARFAALNAALAGDGLLLEVAPGARIATTLHVAFLDAGERELLATPRLLVRCGRGSRLRIIVEHAGEAEVERFIASVIDLRVDDGASLELFRLQRLGTRAQLIESLQARVGLDATLALHDANFGGALARLDLGVKLTAPGATATLSGVHFADAQRHLDSQLRIDHLAPRTTSAQTVRGIAAGRGRVVLLGKAVVHVDAQKSDARQSLRNLLLSTGAEIDARPDLEIYADDVQCSHGATVGQLDPVALFYLRSRGLDEQHARRVLTRAFARDVLSKLDEPEFLRVVHGLLDGRLDTLLEAAS